jgi:hypothetical protein
MDARTPFPNRSTNNRSTSPAAGRSLGPPAMLLGFAAGVLVLALMALLVWPPATTFWRPYAYGDVERPEAPARDPLGADPVDDAGRVAALSPDTSAFPATEPVLPLDRVLDDPAAYLGQTVTVRGAYHEDFGRHGFTLEDGDLVFDDSIVVVTNLALEMIPGWPGDRPREAGALLTVTGAVRRFDLGTVERELRLDLDDTRFAPLQGQPVLVAHAVSLSPGDAVMRDAPSPRRGGS